MRQNARPSNGITVSYGCPADELALVKRLAEENAALVEFDMESLRLNRSTPVEFTTERSGVVESAYIVLDESRRKRTA